MKNLFRTIYFPLSILICSLITIPICILRPLTYKNTALFLKVYKYITLPMMLRFKVENHDILDNNRPAVVVGNHQHNFDIVMASYVFRRNTVSLGKRELAYIPLFGMIFWLAGNILITRGNKSSAKKTMGKIKNYIYKNKLSIVIFPEGHRNKNEGLLPFKKGAFYTAIESEVPIVPFVVEPYLDFKKSLFKVRFLEPISTQGMTLEDVDKLSQITKEKMEQALVEII